MNADLEPLSTALEIIAKVMKEGRIRYPDHRWLRQSVATHIAHAEAHLRLLKEGNQDEDHLSHGATRLLMALCLRAELRPFSG